MAKAIMFQGTGSDVGKTVLVAGLCRAALRRGYQVRPFKPQNMANNAAVADDGGEVGRAQWLQALACGVPVSVHMNPILLKPQSATGSQIIVHGKLHGSAKAREYQALKPELMQAVDASFDKLTGEADLVIVEGAGSPAEVNLRAGDIANMGFATRHRVPVCLVADIDRGGVIASLVGTHQVLAHQDRQMVCGYLINKFRGDASLFDDGIRIIGEHTGWPSYGMLPWLPAVQRLPAEDSVVLDRAGAKNQLGKTVIAVPVLDRIANFDDFDPLRYQDGVELVMVRPGEALPQPAAAVILPGSKSTIADLSAFRRNGWDRQLDEHVARGGHVLGICGGYQMLGRMVTDPGGVEGPPGTSQGLGLLDIETVLEGEKRVGNVNVRAPAYDVEFAGYEIHIGRTQGPDCARPMLEIDGRLDGAMSANRQIAGCYVHGLFAADKFRTRWLAELGITDSLGDFIGTVDGALDELAEAMEHFLAVDDLLAQAAQASSAPLT